jgi:hypothetical protein
VTMREQMRLQREQWNAQKAELDAKAAYHAWVDRVQADIHARPHGTRTTYEVPNEEAPFARRAIREGTFEKAAVSLARQHRELGVVLPAKPKDRR